MLSTPTAIASADGNRRQIRHRLKTPAYALWRGEPRGAGFAACSIVDLSEGGVALQGATLDPGREIELALQLDDTVTKLCLVAQVIWSAPGGRSGLRFLQVSSGSLLTLRHWLIANALAHGNVGRTITGEKGAGWGLIRSGRDTDAIWTTLRKLQHEIACSGPDLEPALQLIATGAHELLAGCPVAIALVTDIPGLFICRARCGSCAPHLGAELHVESGFSGRSIRSGTSLICADTENDARVDVELCRSLGVRSLLAVPVRAGFLSLGLIEVFSAQPHAFGNVEMAILQRLAASLSDLLRKVSSASNLAIPTVAVRRPPVSLLQTRQVSMPSLEQAGVRSSATHFPLFRMIAAAAIITSGLGLISISMERRIQVVQESEVHAAQTAPLTADRYPLGIAGGMPSHIDVLDLATIEGRARGGDPTAESVLARRFLEGDESAGVKPDEKEAARWFFAAAEQGNVTAQSQLGYLFWNGRGVPQDIEKAYFWAAVASRQSSSSGSDPAVVFAEALKQALAYSSLTRREVAAIERRAARWQPHGR